MVLNFDERKDEEPVEIEQVELFTLEGKTYSMPKTVTARQLLGFMQEMRTNGQEAASVGLLIDCIGRTGYQKLLSYPKLRHADLKAIFDAVSGAAMGGMEEMTGN